MMGKEIAEVDGGQLPAAQLRTEQMSQAQIGELLMVAVGLAVSGHRHELRLARRIKRALQPVGAALGVGQELAESHVLGDGAVIKEKRQLPSRGAAVAPKIGPARVDGALLPGGRAKGAKTRGL